MVTTERKRNDFINFIQDVAVKPKLAKDFLLIKSQKALYTFFQEKGYKDIPYNDCGEILKLRQRVEEVRIKGGHPWCPPDPKAGY